MSHVVDQQACLPEVGPSTFLPLLVVHFLFTKPIHKHLDLPKLNNTITKHHILTKMSSSTTQNKANKATKAKDSSSEPTRLPERSDPDIFKKGNETEVGQAEYRKHVETVLGAKEIKEGKEPRFDQIVSCHLSCDILANRYIVEEGAEWV